MRKGSSELSTMGATTNLGDPSRLQWAHARSTLSSTDAGGGGRGVGTGGAISSGAAAAAGLEHMSSSGSEAVVRWAAAAASAGDMASLGFRERRREFGRRGASRRGSMRLGSVRFADRGPVSRVVGSDPVGLRNEAHLSVDEEALKKLHWLSPSGPY